MNYEAVKGTERSIAEVCVLIESVAVADNYDIELNTATDLDVLQNDLLYGQHDFRVFITRQPSQGTASNVTLPNGRRGIRYTPNNNYIGADSIRYRVLYAGLTTDAVTVNLNVATGTTLPEVPTGFQVSKGELADSIAVSWNNNGAGFSYELQHHTAASAIADPDSIIDSNWQTESVPGSTLTAYELASVADGHHYFRVRACLVSNAAVCSGWAKVVSLVITDGNSGDDDDAGVPGVSGPDPISDQISLSAGEFRVDESGAATWQMPLAVLPGISGVQPQLGVSYSSAAGNGPMGMGWSLSGLSAVMRCRQTLLQDNTIEPVTLTDDDRFCLDGQRLILVSGTHATNGAEYRTQIDSQTKVVFNKSTASPAGYFEVFRPDGSLGTYGASDNSLITDGDNNGVRWALSFIDDNTRIASHRITFDYLNDNAFGEQSLLPETVSWSGNTVVYSYRSLEETKRKDFAQAWIAGVQISNGCVAGSYRR